MAYDEFQTQADYVRKMAGAALGILIYEEEQPAAPILGAATGLNTSNEYETIAIEEAGEEGVNEIVQGRHTLNSNLQAFWSPRRGDNLPTRINFIGKTYTIYVLIAPAKQNVAVRPGAGETTDVLTGNRLARRADAFGARGPRTLDLAFQGKYHYTGLQWFELAGSV